MSTNLQFLSKLVKENLPEGQVDSEAFTVEVLNTYKNGCPREISQTLKTRIAEADRRSNLSATIDPDALRTRISPTPYGDS